MINGFLKALTPFRLALPLLLLNACAVQTSQTTSVRSVERGAVSAAHPLAAEAGREILRQGGSAADAAIAIAIALTVVEPQSSGIGGGGFLVYHDARRSQVSTFDGREKAPAAAAPSYFLRPDGQVMSGSEAVPGGKSVGVPGNIRMMELAHERHGKLPWARLFQPAIRLSRDGFPVSQRLRNALANGKRLAAMTPWARRHFYDAAGEPVPVGTILKNPELAALLEGIATRGPDHFYTGARAEALVQTVRAAERNPSPMVVGDLVSYDAKERPPVCGTYRAYRICGMGPPSSGATTVFAILKQLERFDLSRMGARDPAAWHVFGESMRLAYADRDAYLADPEYIRVPVAGLMDPSYLAGRGAQISADKTLANVTAGTPPGAQRVTAAASNEVPSTSHMSAVDGEGNTASLTSTIEGVWGSGLAVNGFFLNNELTDFSLAPEQNGAPVVNRVEGGKRPRSSMSPTIAFGPHGEVRLAVGAAGGPTIIAQVAKTLIGVLDWGLSAQDAIALPNFYLGRGGGVAVERGTYLEAMIPEIRRRGATIVAADLGGKLNAVERVNGRWVGAADPRSEGVALSE